MIKVRVKTLWNGLVAIRNRYYDEAIENNAPLTIIHADEEMEIPAEEVKNIHSRSKETFTDRFSGERHYLVYYLWEPTVRQPKLL